MEKIIQVDFSSYCIWFLKLVNITGDKANFQKTENIQNIQNWLMQRKYISTSAFTNDEVLTLPEFLRGQWMLQQLGVPAPLPFPWQPGYIKFVRCK